MFLPRLLSYFNALARKYPMQPSAETSQATLSENDRAKGTRSLCRDWSLHQKVFRHGVEGLLSKCKAWATSAMAAETFEFIRCRAFQRPFYSSGLQGVRTQAFRSFLLHGLRRKRQTFCFESAGRTSCVPSLQSRFHRFTRMIHMMFSDFEVSVESEGHWVQLAGFSDIARRPK